MSLTKAAVSIASSLVLIKRKESSSDPFVFITSANALKSSSDRLVQMHYQRKDECLVLSKLARANSSDRLVLTLRT
jgi:hypothetical protein